MYPIKFNNLYYSKIWGGRDFEKFRDNLPRGNIGESWDVACHEHGMSIVENGILKGKTLKELIDTYGYELLGTKVKLDKFPLLVKLINSQEKLSVQVHPNDEYAIKNENQSGKTEFWYILNAKPNAKIIVGTRNCSKDEFTKAIKENNIEKYLNIINVKKDDAYLISSGMIHAIGAGIVLIEIQENSDITYRVYDYGRPREIHVEKSLEVIDFSLQPKNLSSTKEEYKTGYRICKLCSSEYFEIVKILIKNEYAGKSEKERFHIISCIEGKGVICAGNMQEDINYGDSIFIPATLGDYRITGDMTILKSYAVI